MIPCNDRLFEGSVLASGSSRGPIESAFVTTSEPESRRRALIRLLALFLALGLTVAGLCLVAFAQSPTRVRLGVPVALWGVLIGAWAQHGSRPGPGSAQPTDLKLGSELHDAVGAELVAVRRELAGLRAEVLGLRQDGAGRLEQASRSLEVERTQTTRVIVSESAASRRAAMPSGGYVGRRRHVTERAARPALGPRHGRADEDEETVGAATVDVRDAGGPTTGPGRRRA